jgi:hypothetical protein
MKITKERLNKIIKEEIEAVLDEGGRGFFDKRAKERRDLATKVEELGRELWNELPDRLPIPPEWDKKYSQFELGIGKVKSAHSTPEVKKDPRLVRQGEGYLQSLNRKKDQIDKAKDAMLPQHKSELVDLITNPITSDRYRKVKYNPKKYSPDRISKE